MLTADKECKPSQDAVLGIKDTVDQAIATLHGIKPESIDQGFQLGPIPTSEVSPIKALLDPGSPVSIVSLEFFIKLVSKIVRQNSPLQSGERKLNNAAEDLLYCSRVMVMVS